MKCHWSSLFPVDVTGSFDIFGGFQNISLMGMRQGRFINELKDV
ncbi:hypothetical protein ACFQDF_32780 [Ectobacillus funiculus]|uniref:Uncharacterized protein n=1 Tax=Ectobacillus funiculus TaxID=137993 RepID=A0ABV5WK83_9BACI